jgi:steroid 5-alpha reductase family enzyme
MTTVDLLRLALIAWAAMAVLMVGIWLVQRRTGNAGIVDVAWTAGLGVIALGFALWVDGPAWRRWALALLAGGWSLRLAAYLFRRVVGHEEDARYQDLRREWGAAAQRNLFLFYQAQAFSAALFALPFAAILAKPPSAPGFWDVAGVAIWIIAVAGEAIADAQLARFKSDPSNRGRICEDGLWGWSRHPNYFFEWLHWWAYVALAAGSPLFGWSLAGPAAMLHFLVNVTGIPTTEKRMLASRGDAFRDYQRRVSAFVPLPPRGR